MDQKKILISGALHDVALETLNAESNFVVDYRPDIPRAELLSIIGDYDCHISRSETDVDKEFLDHAKNLSVVARAAVGIGNIDIDYATEKGVLVFNTPGKNTNSAAELTLGMMLAVIRNMQKAQESMRADKWNRHIFLGTELLGKTVGIIGLGNVGHRVAKFCNGFDCEVLAYDPYVTKDYCDSHNAKKVELEEMIEKCDIITIHTPKNKETIKMIGPAEVAKMKDGVILINAARGGLYDEAALYEGMKSGKIHGLGIDTWDIEPVVDHPLKEFENVVMTPHIGATTKEATFRIGETVSREVVKALKGEIVSTPVNLPEIDSFSGPIASHYAYLAGQLGTFAHEFMDRKFVPEKIEFHYRGTIDPQDFALIRLSFLKSYLKNTVDDSVSYVNALAITKEKGIHLVEREDKAFSDYESAIRIQLHDGEKSLTIGGTVMGMDKPRMSYINGFTFEIEPSGTILSIENEDQPGVIGHVGMVLAEAGVNINRFELSRSQKGGQAMALLMVDEGITPEVVEKLEAFQHINRVKSIQLN